MEFDIVIVGAGPAGLSFAASLAGSGLRLALVERQPEAALADPAFDGREIALTHRSVEILEAIGAWSRIPADQISPMMQAHVLNGLSPYALRFDAGAARKDGPLGHLVPNHLIRRAVYQAATALPEVTLFPATAVAGVDTSAERAAIRLADGRTLTARLAVAADTRFSEMRRRQGISAELRDFGRVMMVCRVAHDEPHEQVATEWFDYGQTIAMLPVNDDPVLGHQSSFVLTLPAREMDRVMAMSDAEFGEEATRRYRSRLGAMRLVSTRHAYPLVAVYATRFTAARFALMGDAAVGMHPVTAHGFNFGLRGAEALARRIRTADGRAQDIADPALLRAYDREHRLATRPTYLATNATALLYADERLPARVLRDAALRVGNLVPPFRQLITARLMERRRAA